LRAHELYAFRGCFDENVQVISCKGKDKLPQFIERLSRSTGFADRIERVVVILDNDNDPQAAKILALKAFQAMPNQLCRFIPIPGENQLGMFEDVLLPDNVAPAQHLCIEQFFQCISACSPNAKPVNGKAFMQVWLATQAPGRMLGSAINEKFVQLQGDAFARLLATIGLALAKAVLPAKTLHQNAAPYAR
jgi:hypothetical protein